MNKIVPVLWRLLAGLWAILAAHQVWANAAQPGIWNAGGTVFTMLYPEDSLTFKKVQMQQERIYIQLYKGYAVVKGTYTFINTTQEKLCFKMGYPVNGIYAGGAIDLNEVSLDSLSQFRIRARNNWLPLLKEAHPDLNNSSHSMQPFSDNWMVWQMTFAPAETQVVEVYFIVNTNDAQIRKGYTIDSKNAFIYLLESGSVWHQPIETGYFYVQLRDRLSPKDIVGVSSGFGFRYNTLHRLYRGSKADFRPTPKDNLVLSYGTYDAAFTLNPVIARSEALFAAIDTFSQLPFASLDYKDVPIGDPYAVAEPSFWDRFPALLTLFVIYAPPLIGIIAILMAIWALIRWIQGRKKR